MKQVLVIAGPTASGKSDFAVSMAQKLGGEIISGDSIQVYRGMDIGSGKIRPEEMGGIPHHLLDIRDIREPYSVSDFQKMARELIERIDMPVIAGGTGLYLKACLYDYTFSPEETPAEEESWDGWSNEALYAQLLKEDPVSAQKIHPNNRQRVLRALSILRRTGRTKSETEAAQKHEPVYDFYIAGCTMERGVLYERINQRVEKMFADGLEEEVRTLIRQGYTFADPGMKGIGYREFEPYLNGSCSLEEVKAGIQKHSRNYAKRQYTWLNHQMPVHWFVSNDPEDRKRAEAEILAWKEKSL